MTLQKRKNFTISLRYFFMNILRLLMYPLRWFILEDNFTTYLPSWMKSLYERFYELRYTPPFKIVYNWWQRNRNIAFSQLLCLRSTMFYLFFTFIILFPFLKKIWSQTFCHFIQEKKYFHKTDFYKSNSFIYYNTIYYIHDIVFSIQRMISFSSTTIIKSFMAAVLSIIISIEIKINYISTL